MLTHDRAERSALVATGKLKSLNGVCGLRFAHNSREREPLHDDQKLTVLGVHRESSVTRANARFLGPRVSKIATSMLHIGRQVVTQTLIEATRAVRRELPLFQEGLLPPKKANVTMAV